MQYPDRWLILKFEHNGQTTFKLFSTWLGGYLDSDSWRLNSGITSIEPSGNSYIVSGYSGTQYTIHPSAAGTSSYTSSILTQIRYRVEATGDKLTVIDNINTYLKETSCEN
jgi:hypothetical protein